MSFSRKKTTSRKRKATHTRGRASSRKPKIKLNKNSVVVLTGVVALACVLLLAVSVILSTPREKTIAPAKTTEQSVVSPGPSKEKDTQPAEPVATVPASQHTEVVPTPAVTKNESVKQNESVGRSVSTKPASVARTVTPVKLSASAGSSEGTAKVPFDIPKASAKAVLVFIFDDAGQSVAKVKRYTNLPFPVTIAVLPQQAHSRDCAYAIRAAGKEVMLHQPMQAENLKINPGAGAITPEMTTFEIASLVKKNLDEIGPVAGLNNHEGSLITEDSIKIGTVLDVAAERKIYFVDSRTTANTKAPQAALERDMPILERDVFLDDVVNRKEILAQIYRALGIANKKGKAIIIGHVDKSADIIPELLGEMYPFLKQKGYTFAFPSQVK